MHEQFPERLIPVSGNSGNLLQHLQQARVVHCSTHAQSSTEVFGKAWIALQPEGPSNENAHLSSPRRHRSSACELLVLDCCEGALGRASKTLSPNSYADAFLVRGIPRVIAGVWAMHDAHGESFWPIFYSFLDQDIPVHQALALAKRRFRQEDLYADPLAWAGWQVYAQWIETP